MSDFLQNAYVYLWGILAVLTFIIGVKQKALYAFAMSVFFVFMTVWYGLRTFGGIAVFDGSLGIAFKCIIGGFLVLFIIFYLIDRRKRQ